LLLPIATERCHEHVTLSVNNGYISRSLIVAKWGNYDMSDSFDLVFKGGNPVASGIPGPVKSFFSRDGGREFLPPISPAQIEQIKNELGGMIGQRIILSNDQIIQTRRAVNTHLQDTNVLLRSAMMDSRIVALLSGEPTAGAIAIAALREGGATHLAMNVPKIFQTSLDNFQSTANKTVVNDLLKISGFKHPLSLLQAAAELGIRLVAVGDQMTDQKDRKAASIESIAIDVSTLLDASNSNKVILWAGSHYIKRSPKKKECTSSLDYLSLNYPVFAVHNGNYLIDGGPLRKIVFDLQCPGAIASGKDRTIDSLPTGIDSNFYGDWEAILLQPKPALDHSYFLTNE